MFNGWGFCGLLGWRFKVSVGGYVQGLGFCGWFS